MAKKTGTVRIGTCGFSYPDWRGQFYPEELAADDWLTYYAERFDTLELRAPFFRAPTEHTLERWRDCVPDDFVFATRAHKLITHNKMLRGCSGELGSFRSSMLRLGNKLGVVLWQIPSGFQADWPRLNAFLNVVTQTWRVRHAFQFRHASWLRPKTYRLLAKYNASVTNADAHRGVVDGIVTADFVYVRKHGPDGNARKAYGVRALHEETQRIREWLDKGLDVYVYFDNNTEGFAAKNALKLKELCG